MTADNRSNVYVFIEPINHCYKVMLAAQAQGYRIVVLHKLDLFAPSPYEAALDDIDTSIRVQSWLDEDELTSLYTEKLAHLDVVGTYSGAEITLRFHAWLRSQLGLPTTSPEVIKFCLNKYSVRKRLAEHGLTKLSFLSRDEVERLDRWEFSNPMYFKPCCGSGSAKVVKCHSLEDCRRAAAQWDDKSDVHVKFLRDYLEYQDDYLLEEAAEGELLSVESVVYDGTVHVIGLTSRTLLGRDPTIEMGGTFPYFHPHSERIVDKVKRILSVLDFSHGPTHAEVIVDDNGNVELVELNIRFAGADILEICSRSYDFDIANMLVELGTKETPAFPNGKPARFTTLQYILPPDSVAVFDSIGFPEAVDFHRAHKSPQTKLDQSRTQIDQVGCFIISNDNYQELLQDALLARRQVSVNGLQLADDINNVVIQR